MGFFLPLSCTMATNEGKTRNKQQKNPPLLSNRYFSDVPRSCSFFLHGLCSNLSGRRQELTPEERTFAVSTTDSMSAKGKNTRQRDSVRVRVPVAVQKKQVRLQSSSSSRRRQRTRRRRKIREWTAGAESWWRKSLLRPGSRTPQEAAGTLTSKRGISVTPLRGESLSGAGTILGREERTGARVPPACGGGGGGGVKRREEGAQTG